MALAENQITLEVVNDGQDGAPGPQGPNGTDGKSAYESASDGGYSGTESQFNETLAHAHETATAFIVAESDGLHVTNDTENVGTDQENSVLIDADSVDIVKNGESVASFEEKKIKLGENSNDSKIEMCGGASSIWYANKKMAIANNNSDDKGVIVRTYKSARMSDHEPYAQLELARFKTVDEVISEFKISAVNGTTNDSVYISGENSSDSPDEYDWKQRINIHGAEIYIGDEEKTNPRGMVHIFGDVDVSEGGIDLGDTGYIGYGLQPLPRIACGTVDVKFPSTGTPSQAGGLSYFTKSVGVVIGNYGFKRAPRVSATIRGGYSNCFCHVNNVTKAGFDVIVTRIANTAAANTYTVDWIAAEPLTWDDFFDD